MKSRSPTNTRRLGFSARPLVLLLLVITVGGLAAAYRLHPKVRKKMGDIAYIVGPPRATYDEGDIMKGLDRHLA